MKKNVIKTAGFLILAVLILGRINNVLAFKYGDGIYQFDVFYEQPKDSIDVMCFGSSRVFENVNTAVLWENYGMASFNLCGSVQPLWNTYYYMKEALKTQHPKVMVLEAYRVLEDSEYVDQSRIIKNNFGLNLTKNKIDSLMVSAPKEERVTYLMEYPTYHSRYAEISEADFRKNLGIANWDCWKGFGMNFGHTEYEAPEVSDVYEVGKIPEKSYEYYMKIIQLAKESNIPLVILVTPCIVTEDEMKIYNAAEQIAQEEGIPFINLNRYYDELGIDFATDFADKNHMNHLGNVKFTGWLGNYLAANYDIPDRRGDAEYLSYDVMAGDWNRKLKAQQLKETEEGKKYIELLNDEQYTVTYSLMGNVTGGEYKDILTLSGLAIDASDSYCTWVKNKNQVVFCSAGEQVYNWHTEIGEMRLNVSGGIGVSPDIWLNSTHCIAASNGLNITVYDNYTDSYIETVLLTRAGKVVRK